MAFAVAWTEVAVEDLDEVADFIARDYRLIYRVFDDRVVVLAFIHGARDLAALWERRGGPDDSTGS